MDCTIEDCKSEAWSRGYCTKHYARWHTHGDPLKVKTRAIDITGQRYGKLIALNFHETRKGKRFWLLLCDCGNEHIASFEHLRNGHTKSCGCLRKKNKPWIVYKYERYQYDARYRNIPFNLTFEDFCKLFSQPCWYCAQDKVGLDRIDNNQGYVVINVISCCSTCNKMKSTLSYEDFTSHIKKIYETLERKQGDLRTPLSS